MLCRGLPWKAFVGSDSMCDKDAVSRLNSRFLGSTWGLCRMPSLCASGFPDIQLGAGSRWVASEVKVLHRFQLLLPAPLEPPGGKTAAWRLLEGMVPSLDNHLHRHQDLRAHDADVPAAS